MFGCSAKFQHRQYNALNICIKNNECCFMCNSDVTIKINLKIFEILYHVCMCLCFGAKSFQNSPKPSRTQTTINRQKNNILPSICHHVLVSACWNGRFGHNKNGNTFLMKILALFSSVRPHSSIALFR
jgi:hypothetical protein